MGLLVSAGYLAGVDLRACGSGCVADTEVWIRRRRLPLVPPSPAPPPPRSTLSHCPELVQHQQPVHLLATTAVLPPPGGGLWGCISEAGKLLPSVLGVPYGMFAIPVWAVHLYHLRGGGFWCLLLHSAQWASEGSMITISLHQCKSSICAWQRSPNCQVGRLLEGHNHSDDLERSAEFTLPPDQ